MDATAWTSPHVASSGRRLLAPRALAAAAVLRWLVGLWGPMEPQYALRSAALGTLANRLSACPSEPRLSFALRRFMWPTGAL